ncbi:hypothetical protein KEJ39_07955 [Candidatus Bathyarchaeota archaeon]|nr:hypothetical protein [Candidatus Bathyarchaeota archaeon]
MMRVGRGVVVMGNATIWSVAVLFTAIVLQGTVYFLTVVGSLCVAGLVSILLVSRVDSSGERREWYEGG